MASHSSYFAVWSTLSVRFSSPSQFSIELYELSSVISVEELLKQVGRNVGELRKAVHSSFWSSLSVKRLSGKELVARVVQPPAKRQWEHDSYETSQYSERYSVWSLSVWIVQNTSSIAWDLAENVARCNKCSKPFRNISFFCRYTWRRLRCHRTQSCWHAVQHNIQFYIRLIPCGIERRPMFLTVHLRIVRLVRFSSAA